VIVKPQVASAAARVFVEVHDGLPRPALLQNLQAARGTRLDLSRPLKVPPKRGPVLGRAALKLARTNNWQAKRDSNPQPADLERGQIPPRCGAKSL
jgi:hypothetical protein